MDDKQLQVIVAQLVAQTNATKSQAVAIEKVAEAMKFQAAATMAATRIGPHGTGLSNSDIADRFREAFTAMFPKG